MAGFLNANLPSDDEEDDNYDPTKDATAEKQDLLVPASKTQAGSSKRKRGVVGADSALADDGEGDAEDEEDDDGPLTPRSAAKKAKAAAVWEQLKLASGVSSKSSAAPQSTGGVAGAAQPHLISKNVNLASLCRPVKQQKKPDADKFWMQQLGVASKKPIQSSSGVQGATASAAAAALQAAKLAVSVTAAQRIGKVMVTETRKFAGKDIQVTSEVDADSKAAKAAAEQSKGASGLDAVLQSLAAAKKVTVLDKTRTDWSGFKGANLQVEEELEGYKKSNDQYLDKVDFLKRSELREYEQERDQRLASDMRSRGRL